MHAYSCNGYVQWLKVKAFEGKAFDVLSLLAAARNFFLWGAHAVRKTIM
jgi:hypothetical protein